MFINREGQDTQMSLHSTDTQSSNVAQETAEPAAQSDMILECAYTGTQLQPAKGQTLLKVTTYAYIQGIAEGHHGNSKGFHRP